MNVFDYMECKLYVEFAQSAIVFNWITAGFY